MRVNNRNVGIPLQIMLMKEHKNTCKPRQTSPGISAGFATSPFECMPFVLSPRIYPLTWFPHVVQIIIMINHQRSPFSGKQCRTGRSCLCPEAAGLFRAGEPAQWSWSASGSRRVLTLPHSLLLGWTSLHSPAS